jgi:hypothetical protein
MLRVTDLEAIMMGAIQHAGGAITGGADLETVAASAIHADPVTRGILHVYAICAGLEHAYAVVLCVAHFYTVASTIGRARGAIAGGANAKPIATCRVNTHTRVVRIDHAHAVYATV